MNTEGCKIVNIMLTSYQLSTQDLQHVLTDFKLSDLSYESIQCAGHVLAGMFGAFSRRDLKLFDKFRYGDMLPGHTQ